MRAKFSQRFLAHLSDKRVDVKSGIVYDPDFGRVFVLAVFQRDDRARHILNRVLVRQLHAKRIGDFTTAFGFLLSQIADLDDSWIERQRFFLDRLQHRFDLLNGKRLEPMWIFQRDDFTHRRQGDRLLA